MTPQPLPTVEPTCETCRCFIDDLYEEGDQHRGRPGHCNRYPKVLLPSTVLYEARLSCADDDDETEVRAEMEYRMPMVWGWPIMRSTDWCGEHHPRTPAADSDPLTLAQAVATVLASVAGHTGRYRIVADGDRMVCEPANPAPLTKRIAEDAKPCTRPPDIVD